MRLGACLVAWVMLSCLPGVQADCAECLKKCNLPFNGTTSEISVMDAVMEILEHRCEFLEDIDEKYQGLNIRMVSLGDILNNAPNTQRFSRLSDALYSEHPHLEVMDLDDPWVVPLTQWLQPLPPSVTIGIKDKFIKRDLANNSLSMVRWPNQYTMYYRKDLFDKHNISLRFDSWENWTEDVKLLQEKERIARNDSEYRAMHIEASGSVNTRVNLFSGLLSGANGGDFVERDGRVSINNPNAIGAMNMILDWSDTILHPLISDGSLGSYWFLNTDRVAVAYMWTSFNARMDEWNRKRDWEVELAPTPGPTGRGIAGSWQVGVSKHTRMMPLAMEMIEEIAKAQKTWAIDEKNPRGYEVVHEDTRTDPVIWEEYCRQEPVYCASMTKYPEFWDRRLTGRPAEGCGPVLDRCVNVIAAAWTKMFTREWTPEQAGASMQSDLNLLIGNWDALADADGIEEWTSERLALIIVAITSAVILLAVCVFMYRQLAGLRKASGCTLPISAFLGLSALILFCVVQVVAITQWDTALRDVSRDLGTRVQIETLEATRLRVKASAKDSLLDNPTASLYELQSYLRADFVDSMQSMRLDARSLVLLLDRVGGTVVVSSDPNRQREKIVVTPPFNANVSEWTKAGLAVLGDGWDSGTVGSEEATGVTISGEKVSVSLATVVESGSKTLDYVLVYFVPDTVVYEEANRSLAAAINVSILLTVGGVLILVVLATFITLPLIALANDMEDVRTMQIDTISLTEQSRLTELGSLILGFQAMCEMLVEYKSFLPKTLFNVTEDEDDLGSEGRSDSKRSASRTSWSEDLSHTVSHGSKALSKRKQGPTNTQIGLGTIQQVRGSLLTITVLEPGKEMETFASALSTVEASIFNGVLHSFSSTHANEIVVSWGLSGGSTGARVACERAAGAALEIVRHLKTKVAIAGMSARVNAGNVGNKKTRAFALFGSGIGYLHRIVESSCALAEALRRSVIVGNPDFTKLPGFEFKLVDYITVSTRLTPIRELTGKAEVAEQEWMYQLRDMETKVTGSTFISVMQELATGSTGIVHPALKAALAAAPEQDSAAQQGLRNVLDPTHLFDDVSLAVLIRRLVSGPPAQPAVDDGATSS
ncbi:hypothetical protein DIPPA_30570 [Diplonema papillatum]|nr:hypothetical protein DIPPA_30570 [Diplonema papillatum]